MSTVRGPLIRLILTVAHIRNSKVSAANQLQQNKEGLGFRVQGLGLRL